MSNLISNLPVPNLGNGAHYVQYHEAATNDICRVLVQPGLGHLTIHGGNPGVVHFHGQVWGNALMPSVGNFLATGPVLPIK